MRPILFYLFKYWTVDKIKQIMGMLDISHVSYLSLMMRKDKMKKEWVKSCIYIYVFEIVSAYYKERIIRGIF